MISQGDVVSSWTGTGVVSSRRRCDDFTGGGRSEFMDWYWCSEFTGWCNAPFTPVRQNIRRPLRCPL